MVLKTCRFKIHQDVSPSTEKLVTKRLQTSPLTTKGLSSRAAPEPGDIFPNFAKSNIVFLSIHDKCRNLVQNILVNLEGSLGPSSPLSLLAIEVGVEGGRILALALKYEGHARCSDH